MIRGWEACDIRDMMGWIVLMGNNTGVTCMIRIA